jgi:hypothetical protein
VIAGGGMFCRRAVWRRLVSAYIASYENTEPLSTRWKVQERYMSGESLSEAYLKTRQKCECEYRIWTSSIHSLNDTIGSVPVSLMAGRRMFDLNS